jgi:LmbE family N-acetylglucosaminyl deacetylase
MAKRLLAIGAHPDDIEFLMAGTMMLLQKAGYELHYITLANGSCGSAEIDVESTVRLRRQESRSAAEFIGATYYDSIAYDMEVFYNRPLLARVGSIVRQVAPEILLLHSPQDYMEDHMNASRLAVTAAFCRSMPNFPVDPPRRPVEQEVTIYHAQPHGNCDQLGNPICPAIFVDIGAVIERKVQMLAQHASQKAWLDKSQGMDSYLESMKDFAREIGAMSGRLEFAEGWRKHAHLGFCRAEADPLRTALGNCVHVS